MSENTHFDLGTSAVYVSAAPDEQKKIINSGTGTVYYDDASSVSASSNDGNLTSGQSTTISAGTWLVSASTSHIWTFTTTSDVTAEDLTVTDNLSVTGDLTVTDDLDADAITASSVAVDGADGIVASADGGKNTLHLSSGAANVGITLGTTNPVELFRSGSDALTITDATTVTGGVTSTGTLVATNAATVGTTLGVTGASTLTGGVVSAGKARYSTIPIGPVAYGSLGTDTTPADGTTFYSSVFLPHNMTLTGIGILNGTAAATDNVTLFLFNSAGTQVAITASTAASGTDAFQQIAFTSTYAAVGPARYWIAYQANGNTTRLRTIAASTYIDTWTGSSTGDTYGTKATITPPTSFTADKGPIAYVY